MFNTHLIFGKSPKLGGLVTVNDKRDPFLDVNIRLLAAKVLKSATSAHSDMNVKRDKSMTYYEC